MIRKPRRRISVEMERRTRARKDAETELVRRIVSIVNAHILLFDGPLIGLVSGSAAEYRNLLDFASHPSRVKIERLSSVLRAHAALFRLGLIEPDGRAEAEIPALLRFLASYAESAPSECAPSAFLPKNLGSVAVRKGLAVPLFGPHRPRAVPGDPGIILCHRSILAGGTARLIAIPTGRDTAARYKGLGVEIDATASLFHCAIVPAAESASPALDAALTRKKPTVFESDRYAVYLAASRTRTILRGEEMDPFRYRYAYFFSGGPSLRSNLRNFLIDLISGTYRFHVRQAETIASLFTERSL